MAQSKVVAVQYPMVWAAPITYEDLGDQVIVDVPPGFVLTDAAFVVDTGFNGTTPTLSAVDNKTAPVTIITSAAITAAGTLAMVAATKWSYYPSGGKITFLPATGGGTPTAGAGRAFVQGVVMGRQNERVGTLAAT